MATVRIEVTEEEFQEIENGRTIIISAKIETFIVVRENYIPILGDKKAFMQRGRCVLGTIDKTYGAPATLMMCVKKDGGENG